MEIDKNDINMDPSALPLVGCPIEMEDDVLDNSTAPTSPEGSSTFSPVLQALRLRDALENSAPRKSLARGVSPFTDAKLSSKN